MGVQNDDAERVVCNVAAVQHACNPMPRCPPPYFGKIATFDDSAVANWLKLDQGAASAPRLLPTERDTDVRRCSGWYRRPAAATPTGYAPSTVLSGAARCTRAMCQSLKRTRYGARAYVHLQVVVLQ